jgi:subtilisin family serine protease
MNVPKMTECNWRAIMKNKMLFYSCVATCFLMIFFGGSLGMAQSVSSDLLSSLAVNGKVISSDEVLADFEEGKEQTSVIVLVRSPEANDTSIMNRDENATSSRGGVNAAAGEAATLQTEAGKELVRNKVSATIETVTAQLDTSTVTVTRRFTYLSGFVATVTPEGLEQLVNMPDVVSVEKNRILHQHLGQGIPLINATSARSSYNGSGISIAVCDTGIDTAHPRLGNGGSPVFNSKVIGGRDTGDGDDDPRPSPTLGNAHGTSCAGIAAGDTGTVGDYIGGVAPGAKLYAIKISTGNTGDAPGASMIAGWEWAVTHQNDDPANPILIISTSFGGGRYFSSCDATSPAMTTAAANAVAAGITIFASSGNDGFCNSMGWPACISSVNSVGAVYDAAFGTVGSCLDPAVTCATTVVHASCTPDGKEMAWDPSAADFVTAYSNSASFLDIFAPSHNAYTTDITGVGGYAPGDYTTTFGGTSAACPYTAGAAAVLQHAAKVKTGSYLTPAQVKLHLVNNGDSVTDGKIAAVTKPRVNLGNAVDALTGFADGEYLLIERFDNITTLPGDGWVQINHSEPLGTTDWFQGNPIAFTSQAGAADSYIAANFNNTSGGTGTISNWLITPALNLSRIGEISFWSRAALQTFPDRLEVRLSNAGNSTDVGTSATDVGDFTTVLLTINPSLLTFVYPEVWTKYVIANIATGGTGRIAFRYFVTNGGPTGSLSNYIGIDSVGVSDMPFPWPMYMAAITGGAKAAPVPPQWGAGSVVCCTAPSSATFSLTSGGVTKNSFVASCASGPGTDEGWVTTTSGTKSFSWTLTSAGCGNFSGSFTYPLVAGKSYFFRMELDASNNLVLKVYENTITSSALTETAGNDAKTPGEIEASMELIGTIPLDIPKGAFSGSSFEIAE